MDQVTLKSLLDYCPKTGIFIWKVSRSCVKAGFIAGKCKNPIGYQYIGINGKSYSNHRLAWLYVYGKWPSGVIDHINGNKNDNSINNLRDVSYGINNQNLKKAKISNKTSGLLGASFHKETKKWRSSIRINGKIKSLGYFSTAEEAHKIYMETRKSIGV